MKLLHHARVSVYCKEGEHKEKIIEKLKSFFPFNLEAEKIKIKKQNAVGFRERQIIIFEVHLEKDKHTKKFIEHLNSLLNDEQKMLLLKQKESRLDKDSHFYIRLDKNKLIRNNKYILTERGNCFHIKMMVVAFPKNRKNALETVERIFHI
ncbi:hypothetical protein GF323_01150 [Candidatus Woesearchaeota archaeon]|nr:hypothetical protein [Candidatus Woesearchaeota archaeon]